MKGIVHGGQNPITGATIKLYVAGSTGYGSAATYTTGNDLLGSDNITTDSNGNFNITGDYTCPSSNSLVYIEASGGNPGLTGTINNTASVLVAALGACGNLNNSTFVNINELTTAAAAFALGQFFTPTYGSGSADTFGAPSTNLIGITNAFATAGNLVNVATGVATTTTVPTTNADPNYFLSTNDQQKLNTIGNILAACVNTTGPSSSGCSTLFAGVTPTNAPLTTSTAATVATDTLQSAVYMSLNPTSTNAAGSSTNLTNLFNLQSAFDPFNTALSAAPTDWTLAVNYFNTNITQLSSAAVDANGDIWFANQATALGGFVELNGGTGTYGGTPGITGTVIGAGGAYQSAAVGLSGSLVQPNQPRVVAIDLNGHAWLGDNSKNNVGTDTANYYVIRATSGIGIDAGFAATTTCTWPGPITEGVTGLYGVAVDPSNNIIIGSITDIVLSISGSAFSETPPTAICGAQGQEGSGTIHPGATGISINSSSVAYAPTNGNKYTFEFSTNPLAAYTSDPEDTSATSFYGNAFDGNGVLWIADNSANKLFTLNGTTYATAVSGGCLNAPRYPAVDGYNNIWVASQGSTPGAVCEYSNNGTLISPAGGYVSHGATLPRGVAIDPSGNVWVTSYPNSTSSVTEIVGAAVPVMTPLAAAVKNSTIGKRP